MSTWPIATETCTRRTDWTRRQDSHYMRMRYYPDQLTLGLTQLTQGDNLKAAALGEPRRSSEGKSHGICCQVPFLFTLPTCLWRPLLNLSNAILALLSIFSLLFIVV